MFKLSKYERNVCQLFVVPRFTKAQEGD